jgi:hypothetical protein
MARPKDRGLRTRGLGNDEDATREDVIDPYILVM